MSRPEPPAEDVKKVAQALGEQIRRAGLSLHQMEERLGIERGELRRLLDGPADLALRHLFGILDALRVPPLEFFFEVYGPVPFPGEQPVHPLYRASLRSVQQSSLRVLIWRLKEKGVFSEEEALRVLDELKTQPPAQL